MEPARFEVASIKASTPESGHGFFPSPPTWASATIQELIEQAFGIKAYQIVGLPKSFGNSDGWDIAVKTPSGPQPSYAVLKEMLRTLLAERFEFRYHLESREISQYVLSLGKSPPKLREVSTDDPDYAKPASTRIGRGSIEYRNATLARFAERLSRELGSPVIDETRLTGKYNLTLKWTPDERQTNSGGVAPPEDDAGPSISAAVRDQLGLQLSVRKAPVDVLVVDHVQRTPIPN
jgi:uncharacterized protein (TIGR03435 family)